MNQTLHTLNEIGEWGSGGTPLSSNSEFYNGSIPWLVIEDLNDDLVIKSKKFISEKGLKNSSAKMVDPNTLLIAMYGSIGKLGITTTNCATNQAIAFCKLNKEIADLWFVFYYLLYSRPKLLIEGRGNTQQNISQSFLKEFPIQLPPLPEQQRIATILQKADRIRRLRRYARKLSNGYLQSVFLEMFGDPKTNQKRWQTVAASEIYEIQLGKMRSEKEITGKFLHQYLRNVNVQWGYLDLTDIKEMDFTPKEMEKYLLQKGDILVCEGGEVGRTAVFNGEVLKCAYQNALHRLRAKSSQINTDYFVHYMKVACDFGIISKLTSQVTIAHFTAEKFADLQIMLPPLGLQEMFSEICRKVYAMKTQQKESERQAEHLFQSLLQRAFQGEL